MNIVETGMSGVLVLEPRRFGDARGWFSETWNARAMMAAGLTFDFVQDNHSFSATKGTLRGLHYQRPPHAQDKLVRCSRGAILDVAVDIRKGSPTYAHWVARELTAENGHQMLIPKGFLHGFVTLTTDCEVQYKCTDYYAPECDRAVRWNDPQIGVDWQLGGATPLLSDKDANAMSLADLDNPFSWSDA
ncbi:dTDP-4-dehydrorhamnose 3,5-epimerase [Pararhodobacter sp.]|uniref:dTDP-4-dehydrorhamnose 3,5-epimerase n=1 Tax=Pararhodobacter sp. TaxID=2127056 RepID=UPI002AFE1066|nr:dTDP-4-dehydrorhamnose 3,5-epimerase [Pararhodobacter sp.]